MKRLILVLPLIFCFQLYSQILDPVKWSGTAKKIDNDNYELIFNAEIEDDWHLYSQNLPEGGALPTTFFYEGNGSQYELIGKTEESKYYTEMDPVFEVEQNFFKNKAEFNQKAKLIKNDESIHVELEYQACKEVCIFKTKSFILKLPGVTKEKVSEGVSFIKSQNFWEIFLLGFLGGFAALLMPCVFPMIPMTVSYFTKKTKSRAKSLKNSLIYGVSIIVIYVGIGITITALFGSTALNELSTNPWVNISFFILFFIFALSFFGAFELTLPHGWISASDKNSDKGGLFGIFFMAFTLALVSFSCTGPIIGTLLVNAAQNGELLGPVTGMFGFSVALALPFTLFAIFPGLINSLPKSGGWLNTFKVVLGFLELAFALKFLSNADLVWQLKWLQREVFIAIWLGTFILMGLYLLGTFKLSHDSDNRQIGVGRLIVAVITFSFVFYLIPGMSGAPLKMLSGLLPPLNYSETPQQMNYGNSYSLSNENKSLNNMENTKPGPHGILTFTDYESGLSYAKENNLPLFLDFTGHACANCRKMEDNVWSDNKIKDILTNKVVVISLYVDERKKLPENEQYFSDVLDKKIITTGNKWSEFQVKHFNANAQPFYVILDHDFNLLNNPVGVEYDIDVYEKWLMEGVTKFKNLSTL